MNNIEPFKVTKQNPSYAVIQILGGDNDLNNYIEKDLQEMLAGMSEDMSVLCLADYLGQPAEVIELTKSEGKRSIESWDEVNTGDPEKLAEFLARALVTYGRDTKIAIGFWSHGTGIFNATVTQPSGNVMESPDMIIGVADEEHLMVADMVLDNQPLITDMTIEIANEDSSIGTELPEMMPIEDKPMADIIVPVTMMTTCDLLIDFTNRDLLTNKETKKMLDSAFNKAGFSGRKVSMIFSDTCLNGMVELLHEFAKHADVIVASEDLEPGDGWNYNLWFEKMAAEPPVDSASWARQAVVAFEEAYGDKTDFRPCTLGAFATDNRLALAFKELIEVVGTHDKTGWRWMRDARERTLRFDVLATYDLSEFTKNLLIVLEESGADAEAVKEKAQALADAFQKCRVHSVSLGDKVKNAQGLSFWFPYEKALFEKEIATYSELSFDADTGWTKYLNKYYRLQEN